MTCPACTPQRPCEVCASLGQPLGLMPETAAPAPKLLLPTTRDARFHRLMARLQSQINRGDTANASKTRMLIRDHCRILRIPVPSIAQRQVPGPPKKGVAA